MTDREFAKFLEGLWDISPEDYQNEEEEFGSDFKEWLEGDDEYEVEEEFESEEED